MTNQSLEQWAGTTDLTLAIVFTDVVGSKALGDRLGNRQLNEVRNLHFAQARRLIKRSRGYEVKTIGDSFLVAFHTALDALTFALSLHGFTGHNSIKIRAGIHVGAVHIVTAENDLSDTTTNNASRLIKGRKEAWIIISNRAKQDIEDGLGSDSQDFKFYQCDASDATIWRAEYRENFSSSQIDTENLSSYLSQKMPDREHAESASVSQLVDQLRAAGFMTLGDIEQAIKRGWSALLAYEPRRYVGNDIIIRPSNRDTRLSDVGAIRSLLFILDEEFRLASGNHFSASQMERINEARALLSSN